MAHAARSSRKPTHARYYRIAFKMQSIPDQPSPQSSDLQSKIIGALREVFDPEIPVNIYDLGLVYSIDTKIDGEVLIKMTLTSPGCPAAASLPGEVESRVKNISGVRRVIVELVWEPPWNRNMMSDAVKLKLGLM